VHTIMRNLPKYCSTKDGKKEILKIADDVEPVLPTSELYDESENPLSSEEIDEKWASKYKRQITYRVKKAANLAKVDKDKVAPLELLETAYKKLTHENMDLSKIKLSDHPTARKFVVDIRDIADQMEGELYEFKKKLEKLQKKK